jgi:hypothetical protein
MPDSGLSQVCLKFGDLHIDDIEWMKLNLRVLDEHEMHQDDEKAIGFILCVQDNTEHVELVQQEQDKGWISKKCFYTGGEVMSAELSQLPASGSSE